MGSTCSSTLSSTRRVQGVTGSQAIPDLESLPRRLSWRSNRSRLRRSRCSPVGRIGTVVSPRHPGPVPCTPDPEEPLGISHLMFTTAPANAELPSIRCVVNVCHTYYRRDGPWVTSTPRSRRSHRSAPLPPWLAERTRAHLEIDYPRTEDPTAPLRRSRKNGGGHRTAGRP